MGWWANGENCTFRFEIVESCADCPLGSMPTASERLVWGFGDETDVKVCTTTLPRHDEPITLSSNICTLSLPSCQPKLTFIRRLGELHAPPPVPDLRARNPTLLRPDGGWTGGVGEYDATYCSGGTVFRVGCLSNEFTFLRGGESDADLLCGYHFSLGKVSA